MYTLKSCYFDIADLALALSFFKPTYSILFKQSVALTGRNTTGPPSRTAPDELRCVCAVLQTTTDDDDDARRQRPLLLWPTTL